MAAEYDPAKRNYSRQTVAIPPGSVVTGCNFAQAAPGMPGILCDGPLRLVECNLVNCLLDPRWTVEQSNTAQIAYSTATNAAPEFTAAEVERLRVLGEILTPEEWAKVEPDILAPAEPVTVVTFIADHPSKIGEAK